MADWLYFDKDTDEDSDLISRRAEIFRSKLITSFKLLDKFTEYGHHRRKGVLFSPDDIDSTYKNRIGGYYRVFTLTEIETDTDTATETYNMQNCSHCTDTEADTYVDNMQKSLLQHTMA